VGYSVEVLADSVSPDRVRLVTLLTTYPRFIHAEMLRHRVFSHSVASSRAIPTERLIKQVADDPFVPETFNKRVKGMGVGEPLSGYEHDRARYLWKKAAQEAINCAIGLNDPVLGVDKSRVNRILEPFLFVTDIITATEWGNFFALRDHPDAQPELQKIARMMREAMEASDPFKLEYGEWHMPLLTSDEYPEALAECGATHYWDDWKRVSAGRCARVSYDKQSEMEDHISSINRANRLIESGHMSPFEHVARPMGYNEIEEEDGRDPHQSFCGNFRGWIQMRKEIPFEHDFSRILSERAAS